MSTVQVSRTTSTVEVSATRPRVEVGTPSLVQHNDLDGRDAADAHPIGAITGLLPLPTADGSRWTVSHPGGANPPAWSNQAAWLDRANVFAAGSVASPSFAIGAADIGYYSPGSGIIALSIAGVRRYQWNGNGNIANQNAASIGSGGIVGIGTGFEVFATDGGNAINTLSAFSGTSQFIFRNAAGTGAAPSATASNASLGTIGWRGYATSAWGTANRASITGATSESWTNLAQGTRISFSTTLVGTTTTTEALRIADNGRVYFINGSAALPSMSFLNYPDTGVFSSAANAIGVATGGAIALTIDASQVVNVKSRANIGSSGHLGLGQLEIASTVASLVMTETDQAVDGKAWSFSATNGRMRWQALTDAGAGGGGYIELVRSGNNVSELFFSDSVNISAGITIGAKIATATNQRLGFWNATPVVQPAAAAQAAPAAQGQVSLTDSTGGTASTTLAAITAGASYAQADMSAVKNALASIAARLAEVRTDVANIKTFQNAARTALVNTGLIKGAA